MTYQEPTDLVAIAESDALKVFTTMADDGKPAGIVPIVDQIKSYAAAFQPPSMDTEEGRDILGAFVRRLTKAKTTVEAVGKGLADVQKDIPKRIDASRRYAKTELEALIETVRAPLTAWEADEQKRVDGHNEAIRWMLALVGSTAGRTSGDLRKDLEAVEAVAVDASTCQEFEEQYRGARAQALEALTGALERALKDEADRAELARLRAADAQRQAKEAEEAAAKQREADAAAQAEREKAIAANAERLTAERLQREAEEKALREQAARDAEAAAERQRAADVEHRRVINRAALDGLTASGLAPDIAKQVMCLIIEGKVPHVRISY